GLGARDTLRLEAGMPLYGHEMNDDLSPKEAGLPCKLDGKDFIGRDAIVARGDPQIKRIGLKVVGRGIPREGCDLYSMDGRKVGWVSSGTHCPFLGHAVAMGYVEKPEVADGAHFNADVRGRLVETELVPLPFYKIER
ncbi:MAG: glycine cleavage T C-terminal barrel domain-containing protein, partial [Oscillospiraceae bacterium]